MITRWVTVSLAGEGVSEQACREGRGRVAANVGRYITFTA